MGETLTGTIADNNNLEMMLALLDAERRLYERLTDIALRKRARLVEGELGGLEAILEEERESLGAVAAVEEDRYALQCRLSKDMGVSPADLTVSRLAGMVSPKYGQQLRDAQQALLHLVEKLTDINQFNSELIQQSLAYVNFMMQTLSGGATGYDEKGESARLTQRMFNRHA